MVVDSSEYVSSCVFFKPATRFACIRAEDIMYGNSEHIPGEQRSPLALEV
jgi:hypothetical protein